MISIRRPSFLSSSLSFFAETQRLRFVTIIIQINKSLSLVLSFLMTEHLNGEQMCVLERTTGHRSRAEEQLRPSHITPPGGDIDLSQLS